MRSLTWNSRRSVFHPENAIVRAGSLSVGQSGASLHIWRRSNRPNLGQGAACCHGRTSNQELDIHHSFVAFLNSKLTRTSCNSQELAREVGEAPEELGLGEEDLVQSAFAKREMARMEARARVEEDLFTRVPLSKQERRRQKASTRNVNSLAAVGDFGDDVADLVERTAELDEGSRKRRLVDTVAEGYTSAKRDVVSGEQDVPLRDTLGVSTAFAFALALATFLLASYRSFGCFLFCDLPRSKLMLHEIPRDSHFFAQRCCVIFERAISGTAPANTN